MQRLQHLKSILGLAAGPRQIGGDTSPDTSQSAAESALQNWADDVDTVAISLQKLEAIALSSVRLAAMGPRLAKVAAQLEKQADDQARHAVEVAQKTKGLTDNLHQAIARLQDASVNVHAVVGDIARIADQTRLLSINASIEASRAGERGRAFNVVAQEVQQLATQTHDSTGMIRDRVQAIQGSVRDIAASVSEKSDAENARGTFAGVTVQAVNAEVQAMAATAEGQRADARTLHGLGEQANDLTTELLLTVGAFRLELHRRAAAEIQSLLPEIAQTGGDRSSSEKTLLDWLKRHPGFELLYVTDNAGRQVVSNAGWKEGGVALDPKGFNRDWSQRSWYRNAVVKPEDVAISDIYRSTATGDFCFTVSAVVHGDHGAAVGVLGADVNFQRLITGELTR